MRQSCTMGSCSFARLYIHRLIDTEFDTQQQVSCLQFESPSCPSCLILFLMQVATHTRRDTYQALRISLNLSLVKSMWCGDILSDLLPGFDCPLLSFIWPGVQSKQCQSVVTRYRRGRLVGCGSYSLSGSSTPLHLSTEDMILQQDTTKSAYLVLVTHGYLNSLSSRDQQPQKLARWQNILETITHGWSSLLRTDIRILLFFTFLKRSVDR